MQTLPNKVTYGWCVCVCVCVCLQAGSLCAPPGSVGAVEGYRRTCTCAASDQRLALPERHTLHAACTWTLCATYHRLPAKQDSWGSHVSPKSTLKCSCGKKTNIQITIIQKIFAQSVIAKHSMGKSGGNIAKYQYMWPWTTKPVKRVNFLNWDHLKAD